MRSEVETDLESILESNGEAERGDDDDEEEGSLASPEDLPPDSASVSLLEDSNRAGLIIPEVGETSELVEQDKEKSDSERFDNINDAGNYAVSQSSSPVLRKLLVKHIAQTEGSDTTSVSSNGSTSIPSMTVAGEGNRSMIPPEILISRASRNSSPLSSTNNSYSIDRRLQSRLGLMGSAGGNHKKSLSLASSLSATKSIASSRSSLSGGQLSSAGSGPGVHPVHGLNGLLGAHHLDSSSAWDDIKWSKLRKIASQVYSEQARAAYGGPSCIKPCKLSLAIGTTKGAVLLFDYNQTPLKVFDIPQGATGGVSSIAFSYDDKYLAAGYHNGALATWDMSKPSHQVHVVVAPSFETSDEGQEEASGYPLGTIVTSVEFVGKKHNTIISAGNNGVVMLHKFTRSLVGRNILAHKLMGKNGSTGTTAISMSKAPLINAIDLFAVITPSVFVVISPSPAQTHFRTSQRTDVDAVDTMGFSGCCSWYMGKMPNGHYKFAYGWCNTLFIVHIEMMDSTDLGKPDSKPVFAFKQKLKFTGSEPFVSAFWLAPSVIALTTITQQMLIINEDTMTVATTVDLLSKHLLHHRYFELQHKSRPVADAFYPGLQTFKGKLFVLGSYELVVGSLANWADRLLDTMESGDYISAIRLATIYYLGYDDLITVGLPNNSNSRHALVLKNLPDMVIASLSYTFKNGTDEQFIETLTQTCLTAAVVIENESIVNTLLQDIADTFEGTGFEHVLYNGLCGAVFDGFVTDLPPKLYKQLLSHYSNRESGDYSPSNVEEIICRLETSNLDLDFALGLCAKMELLDAQIYIWNASFHDYSTPLKDFIEHIESGVVNEENTQKVYPYISYILTGRQYPNSRAIGLPNEAKKMVYDVLFSSDNNFLNLKLCAEYNPSTFFSALNEVFEDSYLNESEPINRQYITDVLLEVLTDRKARLFSNIFIARNYPKFSQFIILTVSSVSKLLEELCTASAEPTVRNECELAVESLLSIFRPPNLDDLISTFNEVGFHEALKYLYKSERMIPQYLESWIKFPDVRAEIIAPSSSSNTTNLSSPATAITPTEGVKFESSRLVEVIQECVSFAGDDQRLMKQIEKVLVSNFKQIIHEVVLSQFVDLMWKYFPRIHEEILSVSGEPQLQLEYLDCEFTSAIEKFHRLPSLPSRHLYITLLAENNEGSVILKLLNTVLTNPQDVELVSIVDVLVETKCTSVLCLLLQRHGRSSEAMIYLTYHLHYLNEEIVEFYKVKESKMAPVALFEELFQYSQTGISLCKSTGSEEKQMWSKLLATQIELRKELFESLDGTDVLQKLLSFAFAATDYENVDQFYQSLVQQTLNAIMERSYSSRAEDKALIVDILGSTMTGELNTLNSVRPLLKDIFAEYKYQELMLTMLKKVLDADTYQELLKMLEMRVAGWNLSSSGECEVCGKKVVGLGIDASAVYNSWAVWTKSKMANVKADDLNEDLMLVIFVCGHIFHVGCLKRMSSSLQCLICNPE